MKTKHLLILTVSILINTYQLAVAQYKFVKKFGTKGTGNGQFMQPYDIEIDDSLNVYVTDIQNNNIQVFDSVGNFKRKFGSTGSGNGQFTSLTGIALDANRNVYVTEGGPNYRVQKLDNKGNYITQWGGTGSANGQFGWARGITVDKEANVYVVDTRLQIFDSSSTFLYKVGPTVDGYNRMLEPEDIVIASDGTIIVHDYNLGIQKYDKNRKYLSRFDAPCCVDNGCGVRGIAIDKEDNIFAVTHGNVCIQKFDKNWNFITSWGSRGVGNGQFDGAFKLTVDRRGYVYVVDGANTRIQIFAPSSIITGQDQEDALQSTSYILPNPATDFITVSVPQEATLRLFSLQGDEVYNGRIRGVTQVYIGQFAKGVYISEIMMGDTLEQKKLIVK